RWRHLLLPILLTLVCLSLMCVYCCCCCLIWRVPSNVCTNVLILFKTDKMSELTETQIESSDDELPEEVAFDASKSAALKSVKDALEAAKREKILLKEKRKKRQQLFQEQKVLSSGCLLHYYCQENVPHVHMKNVSDFSLPDSYTVMRIKDESAAKSLQQKAMDFIQSRLYGPGTKRTTNAELLSLKKKRGASKGAAVEFVNKKLGASQKARIARSNKRFIRQQKLIPF
uniref:Nucleolar protein 7 n=1 Tax=Sinocyclocheilus grahami TaxID=75366 RepID=A0A672PS06_SINGR